MAVMGDDVDDQPESKYREIIDFLRQNNLVETEQLLIRELKSKSEPLDIANRPDGLLSESRSLTVGGDEAKAKYSLMECRSAYKYLLSRIDATTNDDQRREMTLLLWPIYIHTFFNLVTSGCQRDAEAFLNEFRAVQETFYRDEIQQFSLVKSRQHMHECGLIEQIRRAQFTSRLSRMAHGRIFEPERGSTAKKKEIDLLQTLIEDHVILDIYDGASRSCSEIDLSAGSTVGEVTRQANKSKMYYGIFREPDVNNFLNNQDLPDMTNDDDSQAGGSQRKKRVRKEYGDVRRMKNDTMAPPANSVPMLDARDWDKIDRVRALKDFVRRQKFDTDDGLPSACFYTITNSGESVTCMDVTDDSSLLAIGLDDSSIRVWSLSSQMLKTLKSAEALADLDPDTDDVMSRMMDEKSARKLITLNGHSDSVLELSFSSDKSLLLSCSEDGTIRLWSMHTWTCVVVYRGHLLPVYSVRFAPSNSGCTGPSGSFYFASGGHDATVRFWSTESITPLRLCIGHAGPVHKVILHPNCNYMASTAADRQIRIWDCTTGNCVRVLVGHKSKVATLQFSPGGRLLVSGAASISADDGMPVIIWDMANGHIVAILGHSLRSPSAESPTASASVTNRITCLAFSRESALLVSGSTDGAMHIWNVGRVIEHLENGPSGPSTASTQSADGGSASAGGDVSTAPSGLQSHAISRALSSGTVLRPTSGGQADEVSTAMYVKAFYTKDTPIIGVHFTRRNLLLGFGPYEAHTPS